MQCMNIEQNKKGEVLASFLGRGEGKIKNVAGEKRRKKDRARAPQCVELSSSLLAITVYQCTELT